MGCGGRKRRQARKRWTKRRLRTVKPCGPDAPTLASSSREAQSFSRTMVARKPGRQGEHGVSRKTTAQGRPDCLRRTCMLVCAFLKHSIAHETAGAARTRSSPRPLSRVACALLFLGRGDDCKTRTQCAARMPFVVPAPDAQLRIRSWDPSASAFALVATACRIMQSGRCRPVNNAKYYGSRLGGRDDAENGARPADITSHSRDTLRPSYASSLCPQK